MSRVDKQYGFTIVELTLAMAFVSLLMLAVALTVIQIGAMYNKGVVIKQVHQAGAALVTDIQASVAASQVFSAETTGADFRLQKALDGEVAGGRLCTGTISYIWNLGSHLDRPINVYDGTSSTIRFVKASDRAKVYCADTAKKINQSDAIELLPESDAGLAVQDFGVSRIAYNPVRHDAIYDFTIEVGTNDQDMLTNSTAAINTMDTSCKPPRDAGPQQAFCAVNRFDFTARTGDTLGGVR